MKKSENPAKLSKGCKKKAQKCKFVPKYSMLTCFFFKRTYQRTKKIGGFKKGGGCTVGYLSPWPIIIIDSSRNNKINQSKCTCSRLLPITVYIIQQ